MYIYAECIWYGCLKTATDEDVQEKNNLKNVGITENWFSELCPQFQP